MKKNLLKAECFTERSVIDEDNLDFREQIMNLLNQRGPLKTICPSEVLSLEKKKDKNMMEHVRKSASLLASEGRIVITQSGKTVDPTSFKGPIRLKLKRED